MKKKSLLGGITAGLAGFSLLKYFSGRFGKSGTWTMADIPDLTGKVIIVTGANSGIGLAAAKAFTRQGARVILACRSMEKAEEALAEIQAETPDALAEIRPLDLSSLGSVREFAVAFRASYDRLDVLLNNAGIMMVPYGITEDGFERHLGTNHLGHFALTGLLIDLLTSTPEARVVNVSSYTHHIGQMDFENLMYVSGKDYSPARAYGRSKLANLLFTYELQRRFETADLGTLALAAHPGISNTNLASHIREQGYFKVLFRPLVERFVQNADAGVLPSLRAAVDPGAVGGQFYGPDGFMQRGGNPIVVQSNAAAHNQADAQRLWHVSEVLTGVAFL